MPLVRSRFLRTAAAALALAPVAARADDTPLRIASAIGDDLTPILYAQQQGLFHRVGLDVRLQTLTSGSAGAAAVVGGSLDIAKSSLMAIVLAHTRGIPLRIVAPGTIYASPALFAAIVVGKNASITNARALAGKTIAVSSLSDVQWLSTLAWLEQSGAESGGVKFLEIPFSAMTAAVEDGRVDAAVLVSPLLDSAVRSGRVRVLGPVYDGIAKHFLVTAWYAMDGYVKGNADTVRRFAATVRDANAYCQSHPAETLPIIAAFEKIDPATLAGTVRAAYPATLDARDIQPVIDAAAKYKLLERPFPAAELI
jgi:NitT/TauT family transport system substrate-binding protein